MSWFAGDRPRTDDEQAFLAQLRRESEAWPRLGVQPADTRVIAVIDPLCVEVQPPELPHGTSQSTTLQAGFWNRGASDLVLTAEWGDDHLLDASWSDDHLFLGGVEMVADQAARLLAAWLMSQLRRPIERVEWLDGRGEPVASELRLADSGRTLTTTGSRWHRRFRTATRTVIVRDHAGAG